MKEVKFALDKKKKVLYVGNNTNQIIKLFYENGFTTADFAQYTDKHKEYGPLTIARTNLMNKIDLSVFDIIFIEHKRKNEIQYEIHEKEEELKDEIVVC